MQSRVIFHTYTKTAAQAFLIVLQIKQKKATIAKSPMVAPKIKLIMLHCKLDDICMANVKYDVIDQIPRVVIIPYLT